MIIIKNFDKWITDPDKMDSGNGKKIWLINPHNNKTQGWFKYVKKTKVKGAEDLIDTYENISEKLAEMIANELKIKNAKIDIGSYLGESGCLSYNIVNDRQKMAEGLSYISREYPNFDTDKGKDIDSNMYYCLEMILKSLKNKKLENDLFKMLIFDYIIGNSDRHFSNWAIIQNKSGIESFAPLYDNGSSLCSLVKEEDILSLLGKDLLRYNALLNTKSRSLIRIDGSIEKYPTHREVIEYLYKNHYENTKEFVNFIIKKLDNDNIEKILRSVRMYISNKRYELIRKVLNDRIVFLKNLYGRGD